nr:YhjD/YihY/BrkB family envelope integrity protein [Weissella cibaria]
MSEVIKRIFNNRVIKTIIDVSMRVDIVTASSSIAYFGLLSIFPAIIIIATLLPYFGLTISTALSYVQMAVPTSVYDFARPIIESILGQKGSACYQLQLSSLCGRYRESSHQSAQRKTVFTGYNLKQLPLSIASFQWLG